MGGCALNVDSCQERGESPFHGDGEPGAFVGPLPAGMQSVEPFLHSLITKDPLGILQTFWPDCGGGFILGSHLRRLAPGC